MNHCEGCSKQFPKFSPVRDGLCGLCDKLQQAFEKGDEAEIASVKLSKQCLHCGLVFRWNDELLKGIPCGKCSTTPTQAGATKTEQSGDAVRSHAAQGRRGPQHSQAEAYESKPVPAQARRMPSASISRSISRTISGSGRIDEPFEVADSSDHEVIELDFDSDVDEGVKAKSGKIVHGVMQDVQRIRKEVSQFRLKPAPDSEDTGVHNTRNFQKLRNDANQRSLTQKKVMVTMIKSEPVLLWRNGKRDNPGLPAVGHAAFGNTKVE
ncbi:hypothetical protein K474DRAFT_479424 [Panus rudis PR-1116 ss-1]|nr:hypothetical protein K474DRAFT_479424 [Panus rudis PR-1116 ss-1]